MSSKEVIVEQVIVEIVRPRNPLAPVPTAKVSEALVDGLLSALASPPTMDEDTIEEPATEEVEPIVAAEAEGEIAAAKRAAAKQKRAPRNVQERIRKLNPAEQLKLARMGERGERVVLERMYGKAVWEALLRNPKLTPPEVARISRMGALPLPLMEIIVNNRAWINQAQVRRALLGNPRLKKDMLTTVLRATPRNEMKLMSKQMGYPLAVRQEAAKMLK